MIKSPEDVICDLCDRPAVTHLVDAESGDECYLCMDHKMNGSGRYSPSPLNIGRWRLDPDANGLSESWAQPLDSQRHRDFQWEMCEGRLLGDEGACRYYLSALTGIDHFALWTDEYITNLREFVVTESGGVAACFTFDWSLDQPFWPYLQLAYERQEGITRRIRKNERAVELLINHPDWTDEEIAAEVPTTIKQLERNTYYCSLRRNLTQQGQGESNP